MTIHRRGLLAALGAGAVASTAGCVGAIADDGGDRPAVVGETLTLATTRSAYDTGLLDAIHTEFEGRYGVTVDAVAQGTGAALESARNGDADVVMVHARGLEDDVLRNGYGVNRRDLMFNDFVIVGPESDPAGIRGATAATEAFTTIAEMEATFVSRGDNSGTHATERTLWEAAGIDPRGEWYQETGSGMGEALNISAQQDAYTLSDRGTFISRGSGTDLTVLVQGPVEDGPESLANPYGIMAANPAIHDSVNYDLAMAYIGWITSPNTQDAIAEYRHNGEQLFFPKAVSEGPNFEQYVPDEWRRDSSEE